MKFSNRVLIGVLFTIAVCLILSCLFMVSNGKKTGVDGMTEEELIGTAEEELVGMTEEELIEIVLADDHFFDLFVCNDDSRAVSGLCKRSKALYELLKRDDAEYAILSAIQARESIRTADEELERDGLKKILYYMRNTGEEIKE